MNVIQMLGKLSLLVLALSLLLLPTMSVRALDLGLEEGSKTMLSGAPAQPKPGKADDADTLIDGEATAGRFSTASRSSVHSYILYPPVNPALAAGLKSGSASNATCTSWSVSGEPKMTKIAPTLTETRYVYLKCGKKVAEFGPPPCKCSGGWRYVNSCQKPPTVYINLPCR